MLEVGEERVGLENLLAAAAPASEPPREHEERASVVFYSDKEFVAHLGSLAQDDRTRNPQYADIRLAPARLQRLAHGVSTFSVD